MSNKSANNVLDRIHLALNAQSDNEVCQLLDIGRSTLGGWRSRDSVPYALCVELSEERGLSLDWLLTGEGTMYRDQPSEFDPQTLAIARMVKDLDAVEKSGVESFVSDKKFIHEMKRRDMRQSA